MAPRLATILLLGLTGCGGPRTVVVDLFTDLVPRIHFSAVETRALGRTERTVAGRDDDYFHGIRVAELDGIAPETGTLDIEVRLLGEDDQLVASRRTIHTIDATISAVSLWIEHRCLGIECPLPGDDASATTCMDGRCTTPECSGGVGTVCGGTACTAPTDCPTSLAPCAVARCEAGACVYEDDGSCGAGSYCDPAVGCRADPTVSCVEAPCRLVSPQCGCAAGEACAIDLTDGARVCRPGGGTGVNGDPCATEGDCAAGHFCKAEAGGPSRCNRFCGIDADCPAPGSVCANNVNLIDGTRVMDVRSCTVSCDPVAQVGCIGTDACQIFRRATDGVGFTDCVPPGPALEGEACPMARRDGECEAGTICFRSVCTRFCYESSPTCSPPRTCMPESNFVVDGIAYGACL